MLGPSFLQACSSAVLTDTHESPEALFMDTAKVSVAGVSMCSAILLQVSADDAVGCLAHLRAAAARARASLKLQDISAGKKKSENRMKRARKWLLTFSRLLCSGSVDGIASPAAQTDG